MGDYFEMLAAIVVVVLGLYYYSTSTFDFWKSRGVPGPRPLPFFGHTKDLMLAKRPSAHLVQEIYNKYKDEGMVGLYAGRTPVLFLKDPELIKDVFIRDFSKFSDRGFNVHEKVNSYKVIHETVTSCIFFLVETEPLSSHLFNLESERWRPLRARLTPIFTSGKLKDMFTLIVECSEHFEKYLDVVVAKTGHISCRELTAKFTTDVIGACAFGIDTGSLGEEDSEFRQMGRKIFAVDLENVLRLKVKQFLPKLYDLLGYVVPERRLSSFFTKVITDTLNYRRQNKIVRHDFVNTLMDLQDHPEKLDNIKLTDSLLTAQAFVFFAAGFETSSSAMSNALYELAQNHEVQDNLRKEIVEHYAKHDGNLKYEEIKEMGYLDKVFKEILRKYPPGGLLMRKATASYTFNGTTVTVPKGTMLWIPLFAIHRDPDIYPNPDSFDPERFSEDAVSTRHTMHYMPFGDGPRNCIGARFAVYEFKVGLIKILRRYKVDVCEKTMIPYEFDPGAFLLTPKEDIYLRITKVDS